MMEGGGGDVGSVSDFFYPGLLDIIFVFELEQILKLQFTLFNFYLFLNAVFL